MNSLQKKIIDKLKHEFSYLDFKPKGPNGEPYYYSKHKNIELFIDELSVNIYRDGKDELWWEIYDFGNDETKMADAYLDEVKKVLS